MTARGNIIRGAAMLAGILLAVLLVLSAQPSDASGTHQLTVDGIVYSPTQETGGAVHYFTPGTSPTTASTERHTWLGNGSEHLPCSGRLHWIDNVNLLVISHCEETETSTTTTTRPPVTSTTTSTTSTLPPTTSTTTLPPTTTTTEVQRSTTTTTDPSGSTTTVPPSSTTIPTPDTSTPTTETPVGAVPAGGGSMAALVCGCPVDGGDWAWFMAAGAALLALSGLALYRARSGGQT